MTALDYPDDDFDTARVGVLKRIARILFAVILLIPCIGITLLFTNQIMSGELLVSLHQNPHSILFGVGVLSSIVVLCTPVFRRISQQLYIFGHEATHALFVYLCFGEVREFQAHEQEGYIIANRSNILVALAPYIFPFWTLIASLVYAVIFLFFPHELLTRYYFWVLGATWSFNIWWTLKMIPIGQTDLRENGTLLSLTIIYFMNMLLMSVLFEAAGIDRDWSDWVYQFTNNCLDIFKIFS